MPTRAKPSRVEAGAMGCHHSCMRVPRGIQHGYVALRVSCKVAGRALVQNIKAKVGGDGLLAVVYLFTLSIGRYREEVEHVRASRPLGCQPLSIGTHVLPRVVRAALRVSGRQVRMHIPEGIVRQPRGMQREAARLPRTKNLQRDRRTSWVSSRMHHGASLNGGAWASPGLHGTLWSWSHLNAMRTAPVHTSVGFPAS